MLWQVNPDEDNHRLESRMRENRTYGSEGGEGISPFRPLSFPVPGHGVDGGCPGWIEPLSLGTEPPIASMPKQELPVESRRACGQRWRFEGIPSMVRRGRSPDLVRL
jgi:hypothetical protein